MTKTLVFSTVIAASLLAACGSTDYSKTPSGITYKIVEKGSGPQVKLGQFLQVHYTQKINDSTLMTSEGGVPVFTRVDSVGPVYNAAEVFRFLHKGDSIVVVQEVDSLMKQNPMLPPFMKKGDKLYLHMRVTDILDNEQQVQAIQDKEMAGQKDRDQVVVDEYIKKNNITANKIGKGTYVKIDQAGSGAKADSGKFVSVKYRGKIMLTGKEFESTMEPGKDPITFPLGVGQVIPGWDEGIQQFSKGGKGTLYIPGFLSYGSRPGPGGLPNEALMFDIEVVDVQDSMPQPKQNPLMPPVDGKQ